MWATGSVASSGTGGISRWNPRAGVTLSQMNKLAAVTLEGGLHVWDCSVLSSQGSWAEVRLGGGISWARGFDAPSTLTCWPGAEEGWGLHSVDRKAQSP